MRRFGLAVLLVCLSGPARAQTPTQFAADSYSAAAGPRAIVAADFNRDSWLDLATAGTGGSVRVLLNNGGAGGFRALAERVLGRGPFDMAAGDLNRDGIPDLVVANADADAVDVLIGAGNGTFSTASRFAIAGGNPRGVALGDLDRDGKLDIIVTEYATNAWRVLYGDGNGGISRQSRFGAVANPQGVVAADFNRDGRLDVAIAGTGINRIAIFYSTSSGGLSQKNVTVPSAVNVLTVCDFQRNGWLDLCAASSSANAIYTLIGGPLGLRLQGEFSTGASPRGIVAADVNHDGAIDLITANRASSTVTVHAGSLKPDESVPEETFSVGAGGRAVAVGDFDHDGRLDLATADELGNSATVLSNRTLLEPAAFRFSRTDLAEQAVNDNTMRVADMDRDGRLDIVGVKNSPRIVFNDGDVVDLAPDIFATDIAAADFDGDGAPDVVITEYWMDRYQVYLNRGSRRFEAMTQMPAGGHPLFLAVADFNRDGKMDFVYTVFDESRHESLITIMRGVGDGTFTKGSSTYTSPASKLIVADINRDGSADIIIPHYNQGGLTVWYGDGNGGRHGLAFYEFVGTRQQGPSDVAVTDLNEDGKPDLIANIDSGVMVRLAADVEFGPPVFYAAAQRDWDDVFFIAAGDLDGDGHVDIVTERADILFGRGDGTLHADDATRFDDLWLAPIVADYDGDGLLDLWAGGSLMLNHRGGINQPPTVSAGPDRAINYVSLIGDDFTIDATGSDPDLHELRYQWRNEQGAVVSNEWDYFPSNLPSGRHMFTVTVFDGRGGQASDSMVLTVEPYKEIYMHAAGMATVNGAWRTESDLSAASERLVRHPNANAAKIATPLASPTNFVDLSFAADPSQTYKLWIRMKADSNSWSNDSVFVQFDGATDTSATAVYQIGTTSALDVNLEECSGCGVSGWGWEDDGWGAKDRNGTALLRFPDGRGRIRIQTREDGVSIDQVVLSAEKYFSVRPGAAKNDTLILPMTVPRE